MSTLPAALKTLLEMTIRIRLLGVIHGLSPTVPGRFRDYISIPKSNGYRSLLSARSVPPALIHDEGSEGFELITGGPGDLGREFSKVVEALVTESMPDGPINILIGMHCEISKAGRSLHLARERFIDDCQFG
jgi:hypothetical protein